MLQACSIFFSPQMQTSTLEPCLRIWAPFMPKKNSFKSFALFTSAILRVSPFALLGVELWPMHCSKSKSKFILSQQKKDLIHQKRDFHFILSSCVHGSFQCVVFAIGFLLSVPACDRKRDRIEIAKACVLMLVAIISVTFSTRTPTNLYRGTPPTTPFP